ncbi:DgyrCDS9467 [Dimorphilus gyrociliatus]|uniref:DgyrCDS9467 n=1 Tax=Dimorphilus gyrociliatus TaxID=2664684 RepID=A0A7I8VXF0_9ANNE|nr:DgyrCDS9467 [Dimorphilus gyrociliatus]
MRALITLLWICLFVISVQSSDTREDEDFKLHLIGRIDYTVNSPVGKFYPSVGLYASKSKEELQQLKKGGNITLVCSVDEPKKQMKISLFKKFEKDNGDSEYKFLGGHLNSAESPPTEFTKNRYFYPVNYKSYAEKGYGRYLRFTMTDIGPNDMGEFACRPSTGGISPNTYIKTKLVIPYLPIESTELKEITQNINETVEKELEKESEDPIIVLKSDKTKRLQYKVSLKTEEKPIITFDGGEHEKESPVKWDGPDVECDKSKIDVIYQHTICYYTYTAKFSDFKLTDNQGSIRLKAAAKKFESESDIIHRTLKIVSKPEFECQDYTHIKKSSSGPFNISCSIYMNPLTEDWKWSVNEEFELHPLNKTVIVDNTTITVESSKIDDEYKLELVLSTNEFDVSFLESLDLKLKAENEHGSNEKEISISWAEDTTEKSTDKGNYNHSGKANDLTLHSRMFCGLTALLISFFFLL